jgi:hypothetical protein
MKKYLDIRNFIILILILLCTIEFLNPKGFMPNRTKLIHQIDMYNIYYIRNLI